MGLKIAPHEGEDFCNERIADGVEDLISSPAAEDELLRAEHGEMLRYVGLLHSQLLDQRPRREFALAKQFHDGDAGGVSKRLKHICLEAS